MTLGCSTNQNNRFSRVLLGSQARRFVARCHEKFTRSSNISIRISSLSTVCICCCDLFSSNHVTSYSGSISFDRRDPAGKHLFVTLFSLSASQRRCRNNHFQLQQYTLRIRCQDPCTQQQHQLWVVRLLCWVVPTLKQSSKETQNQKRSFETPLTTLLYYHNYFIIREDVYNMLFYFQIHRGLQVLRMFYFHLTLRKSSVYRYCFFHW